MEEKRVMIRRVVDRCLDIRCRGWDIRYRENGKVYFIGFRGN